MASDVPNMLPTMVSSPASRTGGLTPPHAAVFFQVDHEHVDEFKGVARNPQRFDQRPLLDAHAEFDKIQSTASSSRALTIGTTPVRMGSTQGKPSHCEVVSRARSADAALIFEVLSEMPTNRACGLVRRAADT
jgi:hypothetical protein